MSVGEMQACLARLYVDAPFRRLFQMDPGSMLSQYRLDAQEINALKELDGDRLEYFAASLVHKRRKGIERAYPLLFIVDRPELEHYFARFHQLFRPRPGQALYRDALDFGEFIEQTLLDAPGLPAWASALARYERLFYAASFVARSVEPEGDPSTEMTPGQRPRRRPGVSVARFGYDVVAIEAALHGVQARGNAPAAALDASVVAPADCHVVFLPDDGAAGARMLRVNASTHDLIERCDGQRNIAEVISDTEAAMGASGLAPGIADALRQLAHKGVLTCRDVAPEAATPPLAWTHTEAL